MGDTSPLDPEIEHYYRKGQERDRLVGAAIGRLEFDRTVDVLTRYLPARGRVLDVGGGPGRYAAWLAANGYEAETFDPVELHVHQASELAADLDVRVVAERGEAREIRRPDGHADAVLLLGPLYHLTSQEDRLRCLDEARRVLRTHGVVIAAGISRFAPVLDNLAVEIIDDDGWWSAVRRTTEVGEHPNPQRTPGLFTTAFFSPPRGARGRGDRCGVRQRQARRRRGAGAPARRTRATSG